MSENKELMNVAKGFAKAAGEDIGNVDDDKEYWIAASQKYDVSKKKRPRSYYEKGWKKLQKMNNK